MKAFLEKLLPRIFPGLPFLLVPHTGKSDLEASIPRKLRGWKTPDTYFIVVRDCDGADYKALESRLLKMCSDALRPETLVKTACQELEAWYLGDLESLKKVYRLSVHVNQNKQPYREPDGIGSPSAEVKRLAPDFQKTEGARRMGEVLSVQNNASPSFQRFVAGVADFTKFKPALSLQ